MTLEGPDGRTKTFSATLVGVERSKDLAVIKVNAPKEFAAPATIGVSRTVRVGQAVFAIGNPFGFDHTLTTGVVSGLNRTIQSQAELDQRRDPDGRRDQPRVRRAARCWTPPARSSA